MDYFAEAMTIIRRWEGGWSNDPRDAGGLTRWGWTLKTLIALAIDVNGDGKINAADLRDLTEAEAAELYRVHFWDVVQGDALPGPLAMVVFNSAVNQGPGRAARFLQGAVAGMGYGVVVDGDIGPVTVSFARRAWDDDARRLLREVLTRQILHYSGLSAFVTYGKGWIRRTMDIAIAAARATVPLAAAAPLAPPAVAAAPAAPVSTPAPSRLWSTLVSAIGGGGAK